MAFKGFVGLLAVAPLLGAVQACDAQTRKAQSAASAQTLGSPRAANGVYVATRPLLNANRSMPDQVYRDRSVSGVYIETVWSVLEPADAKFDFTTLDREVARARDAGKNVSLSVIAGGRSPAWLAAAGAKTLQFRIGRGAANSCDTIAMPLPWDKVYQDRYARVMAVIARRIGELHALDRVRIVKLTGVGRITEEMRLPLSIGRQGECGETDADARWAAAGYRPDVLIAAWINLARSVDRAFPNALLSLDVLDRNDLPMIGADGRPSSAYVDLKPQLTAEATRAFPGRFAIQWDGLNPGGRVAEFPLKAKSMGARVGWQTNMFRGFEGSGCGDDRQTGRTACTAPDYARLLQRGVATGATYIEVWPEDLARFPDAIAAADQALRAKAVAQ